MKKIALQIAYNGSKFYGSAPQIHSNKTLKTIYSTVQEALSSMGIKEKLEFAGRTDRGVHAKGQIISFCVPSFWAEVPRLIEELRLKVAPYISISKFWEVPLSFNPRYSAKKRVYCYILTPNPSPFEADFISRGSIKDIQIVKSALSLFVGTHNFEFFSKTNGKLKSYTRTVYVARLFCLKNRFIFVFVANGFLYSQVRLMVGSLLAIDKGGITLKDIKEQLDTKKMFYRIPAPPNGLYLSSVVY